MSTHPAIPSIPQRVSDNARLRALLEEWLADESGDQERAWPILKRAMNASKPERPPFSD